MPDEDSTKEKQAKADEEAKKEGKDSADPVEPVTKSQERDVWDWRVQNDNKPLWTRSPKDVSLLPTALFYQYCMSTEWECSLLLQRRASRYNCVLPVLLVWQDADGDASDCGLGVPSLRRIQAILPQRSQSAVYDKPCLPHALDLLTENYPAMSRWARMSTTPSSRQRSGSSWSRWRRRTSAWRAPLSSPRSSSSPAWPPSSNRCSTSHT